MAAFLKANMEEGSRILSPERRRQLYQPVKNNYALGFFNRTLKDGSSLISHGGSNRGWHTQFLILPEQEKAIGVLTNSGRGKAFWVEVLTNWCLEELDFVPAFIDRMLMGRVLVKGAG